MTDFSIEVEIQAPPALVWEIMRDVKRWPEWTPTVTSVRLMHRALRVGSRAISPAAEAADGEMAGDRTGRTR